MMFDPPLPLHEIIHLNTPPLATPELFDILDVIVYCHYAFVFVVKQITDFVCTVFTVFQLQKNK